MPKTKKIKGPLLRAQIANLSTGLTEAHLDQLCDGPLFGLPGGFGELKILRYPKDMRCVSHERFLSATRKELESNRAILAAMAKVFRKHRDAIMLYCDRETLFRGVNGEGDPWAWHAFEACDIDLSQYVEW
jgi:hypothetical protein